MVNLQLIISPSFLINFSLSGWSCHFASMLLLLSIICDHYAKERPAGRHTCHLQSCTKASEGGLLNKCPSQFIRAKWRSLISHHVVTSLPWFACILKIAHIYFGLCTGLPLHLPAQCAQCSHMHSQGRMAIGMRMNPRSLSLAATRIPFRHKPS